MSQTFAQPQPTINWNLTLDYIKRGKSILFLGPEIYRLLNFSSVDKAIAHFLEADNPDHSYIRSYYEQDGLFFLREKYHRGNLIYDVRRFYAQDFPETVAAFHKLARIPFQVIVVLTPDNRLSQIFQEAGIDHQFNFYEKNKPPRPLQYPIEEKPIIYNLLGYLEEEESLILTHDDLYDYFKSVHKGESMGQELQEALANARQYCFLGFPYRKWYMQMLLRILSVHLKGMPYERLALEQQLEEQHIKMYHEQFEMQFVESNFVEFVNELHRLCEAQNLLRPLRASTPLSATMNAVNLDEVLQAIGQGNTEKALEMLLAYVEPRMQQNADLYTQVLVLKSRYFTLQNESNLNIISQSDKQLELAKIMYTSIQLATEARKLK